MRCFVLSILIAAVLVTLVTGCGGAHRYDTRLVQADSLMWTDADSALTTLTAIDSLMGEGNLAYRDLLLTQARYKCYADITAGDDSAITRTMDYYRAHSGEREKLTRAYLYKGAVMEELGHIDSAMYYYKTAEATADPKDYYNLGQINTRIGNLYRLYYADRQICFDKYKQALKYYQLTNNKTLQFDCLLNMGACSATTHIGNAKQLLRHAIDLAIELNDSAGYYTCQELLCRQLYYSDKSLTKAKQIALDCLNNYRQYVNQDLLLDLADIYALSGMQDSARYYLNLISIGNSVPNIGQIKTRQYFILSRIAKSEGDNVNSSHYESLAHHVSDSILNNKKKYRIEKIENDFNHQQHNSIISRNDRLHRSIIILVTIAAVVIALLLTAYLRRLHRYDKIIENIQLQSADQLSNLSLLKQNIEKLKIQDHQLKSFISSHLNLMSEMIEACYYSPKSKLTEQVKRIVQFQHDNHQQWTQLYHYIDAEYNGIISKTHNAYPQLNDKDLLLIALTATGFSYIQIAIIMGYANATSVGTIKQRLAKKMHLDGSLNDYINSMVRS